jgi:hypothetical protein
LGGKPASSIANFPSSRYVNYSYANPYPTEKVAAAGYLGTAPGIILAGDMNPGGEALTSLAPDAPVEQMRKGNSKNHGGSGQNLLYVVGSVTFVDTPFAGVQGPGDPHYANDRGAKDNIYTVSGSKDGSKPTSNIIQGSPASLKDTILLPVADVDSVSSTDSVGPDASSKVMLYVLGGGVLVVALGVGLFIIAKRRNQAV